MKSTKISLASKNKTRKNKSNNKGFKTITDLKKNKDLKKISEKSYKIINSSINQSSKSHIVKILQNKEFKKIYDKISYLEENDKLMIKKVKKSIKFPKKIDISMFESLEFMLSNMDLFKLKKKLKEAGSKNNNNCAICLENLEEKSRNSNNEDENNNIISLHCKHKFHKECLYNWILRKKENCPLCRASIVGKELEEIKSDPLYENISEEMSSVRSEIESEIDENFEDENVDNIRSSRNPSILERVLFSVVITTLFGIPTGAIGFDIITSFF